LISPPQAFVAALRASNCENALKNRPVFDTTDPALAACEMELCDIFEGRFWASVDDGAKEHCIYLFADFLYRNWTTHALVLDCFQQELKTLPPVLQFALLQALSYARSRLQQEAVVWVARYACKVASDKEAEAMAEEKEETDAAVAAANASAGKEKGKGKGNGKATPASPTAAAATVPSLPSPTTTTTTSAASAAGALNLQSLAAAVDATEQLSAGARARLSGLAFECLHTVKSRYLELQEHHRWQHPGPEARALASLAALIAELEAAGDTARNLAQVGVHNTPITGSTISHSLYVFCL